MIAMISRGVERDESEDVMAMIELPMVWVWCVRSVSLDPPARTDMTCILPKIQLPQASSRSGSALCAMSIIPAIQSVKLQSQ